MNSKANLKRDVDVGNTDAPCISIVPTGKWLS